MPKNLSQIPKSATRDLAPTKYAGASCLRSIEMGERNAHLKHLRHICTRLTKTLCHTAFQRLFLCGIELNLDIQDLAHNVLNGLGLVSLVVPHDCIDFFLGRIFQLCSRVS